MKDVSSACPMSVVAPCDRGIDLPREAGRDRRMPSQSLATTLVVAASPPFAETLAITSSVAVVLDIAFGCSYCSWHSYAFAVGIALPAGAAAGCVAAFISRSLSFLRPWLRSVLWCLLGAAMGAGIAVQLGAGSKIRGPHALMAVATLVLVPGAAAIVGWLTDFVLSNQSVSAETSRKQTAVLAAATAIVAVAQQVFANLPNSMPLTFGLTWSIHWLAALAIVRLGILTRLYPIRPFFWATCAFAALLAGVLLTPARRAELAVISDVPAGRTVLTSMRFLTDIDGDGVSHLFGENDCAPWNAAIHPGAREVPNNGIDDNCLLGDTPLTPEPPKAQASRSTETAAKRNVVLITFDTLRPDHMSLYGYARRTTPNLERHMARGWVFSNAYTSGGHTALALPSMLRGKYPRHLVWACPDGRFSGEHGLVGAACGLVEHANPGPRFPETLRARGLRTLAASTMLVHHRIRGEVDTDSFDTTLSIDPFSIASGVGDDQAVSSAIAALASLPKDQHFFLWVHLFGPHEPSLSHPHVPEFGDSLIDDYDEMIAEADVHAGRLLDYLASRPDASDLFTVITADHGEQLGDNTRSHGTSLVPAAIRIPLLVRGSETDAAIVAAPASLVDVAPTILSAEGLAVPGWMDGVPLQQVRTGNVEDRVVFTDSWPLAPRVQPYEMIVAATDAEHTQACDGLAETMHLWRASDCLEFPRDWVGEAKVDRVELALLKYIDQTDGTFWRQ